jgi:hypothetical protein
MSYCPNCAYSLPDGAASCPRCGAQFGAESAWRPLDTKPAVSEFVPSPSATEATVRKGAMPSAVKVILVFELISLLPWAVVAALPIMAFGAGYGWINAALAGLVLAYPVLIAIFAVLAFWFKARGNQTAAIVAICTPPAIAFGVPAAVLFLS